jgi:general secretion pathway protein G
MNNCYRNGFTLIEIVVVLAIIGVLAGILVPMVKGYLGSAQERRAEQDTQALSEAILAFNKDTARFPIFQNGNATSPSDPVFVVLKTAGGQAPAASVDSASWLSATSDTFENQLGKNTPGGSGAAYPATGEFAWRGPYVGEISYDPWGSRYVCNANKLLPNANNAAWVLSAGPNKTIETTFSQSRSAPTIGGDDIAFRIK